MGFFFYLINKRRNAKQLKQNRSNQKDFYRVKPGGEKEDENVAVDDGNDNDFDGYGR